MDEKDTYQYQNVCNERHKPIDITLNKLDSKVSWLYVFVILTLGGVIVQLIGEFVKK